MYPLAMHSNRPEEPQTAPAHSVDDAPYTAYPVSTKGSLMGSDQDFEMAKQAHRYVGFESSS